MGVLIHQSEDSKIKDCSADVSDADVQELIRNGHQAAQYAVYRKKLRRNEQERELQRLCNISKKSSQYTGHDDALAHLAVLQI